MPRSWLQRRKTPWGWWALSPPPPWGQLQPHHYGVALGWVPLATPYTYRWPRGVRGSRPCPAAPAVPAGPCGSSQTALAPLANRVRRVALGDRVALADPRREGRDDR